MAELTALETAVLDVLLRDDLPQYASLREQVRTSKVRLREMTGVGFFTQFTISPEAPLLPGSPSFELGDVAGSAAGVQHGLGFLLFVRQGKITGLEGYTYDEPWPDPLEDFKVFRQKVQKIKGVSPDAPRHE